MFPEIQGQTSFSNCMCGKEIRGQSPEVDDIDGLAVAATKHVELLKLKERAKCSFIIEKSHNVI